MDVEDLIAEACASTRLDDFGGDSYREGLDVLVDSVDREAQLNEIGEAAIALQITNNLANRLRIVDWCTRHPETLTAAVERPLFILGMPRTGTTMLSYLLDQDPATRSLMRWEAMDPLPPPEAASFATDPRIAAAAASSEMLDALNPEFKVIHYEAPDGPTECVTLLAHDFKSLLWETLVNVPTYAQWSRTCNFDSAYAHHRRSLQVLQSRAPGHWSLKSPAHCLALDTLVAHYPDARFVMTHRDPLEVCASLCSLVTCLSGTFTDADHREYIVDHWVDVAELAVCRVMEFRDHHGDDAFVDLRYEELVNDPIGSVQAIYEHFDEELSDETMRRMTAYADANRRGTYGVHRYTPTKFGFDRASIDHRFGAYRSRFGV